MNSSQAMMKVGSKLKWLNSHKMVFAYHPEQSIPYEFTKPIPKQVTSEHTPMKDVPKDIFTKAPNLEQLQSLTYTPASYWRQNRSRELRKQYKAAFDDNIDRTGLTN